MNEKTKRYPWFKDVRVRTNEEPHRQSTWLELFLDLCFVICVGALARTLLKDHSPSGIWVYLALFVPIWWALMTLINGAFAIWITQRKTIRNI